MKDALVKQLLTNMEQWKQVVAVTIGGSRATSQQDVYSDYDIYVYTAEEVPEEIRRKTLSKFCSYMEIGNHYWELEDNCRLMNGIDMDLVYRDLDEFSGEIESVVAECTAHNGYTTCMWNHLLTCKIQFDTNRRLEMLKNEYDIPYPDRLQKNIIMQNRNLLNGVMSSFDQQIVKAVKRQDLVSINHRVTEFLASYFDIIFALNKQTHPGEKRLIPLCKEKCKRLPAHFEENLNELFKIMYVGDCSLIINQIVLELDALLK